LQTEQDRKQTTYNGPDDTRYQKLLTDRFVIHAEDILRDKRLVMMPMMFIMMSIMHHC
jgi:hypothetical protein